LPLLKFQPSYLRHM